MIMLCGEFERACALDAAAHADAASSASAWRAELHELAAKLTESCRAVDPASTDQLIAKIGEPDVIDAEAAKLAGGAT
jgi:hypothetical protein